MEILILEQHAETYAARLTQAFPHLVFHAATSAAAALERGAQAQVLVALAHEVSDELLAGMPHLRWICALTTGTDHLDHLENLDRSVIVTSGRGIHGPQMSEMAFLYMLSLSRDFGGMQANQRAHVWQRWPQRLLLAKTALIVGVGAISEDVATRCKAFGMHTIGISSARTSARGFDDIRPRDALQASAAEADFVIVLVPYSPATHHMIDAAVLGAMKPSGILINLARGNVIDEAQLIRHLAEKRIAGAGLDVFSVEPLPAESPLWDMANVIITPRVGGMSDTYAEQILPLIVENLTAFAAGDTAGMRNIVQRSQ